MRVPTADPTLQEPAEPSGIHVKPPDTPWTAATRALEMLHHPGVRRFAFGLAALVAIALAFLAHWDLRSKVEQESSRSAVAGVAEQVTKLSERVTALTSTVTDMGRSVQDMQRVSDVQRNRVDNVEARVDVTEQDIRDLRAEIRAVRWERAMEPYNEREARPRPGPR